MLTLELFPLATLTTLLIIGGPVTLIILIRALNYYLGNIWVKPVATGLPAEDSAPLGLVIRWDNDTFDYKVCRIRLEYVEVFRGGRSLSTTFTFEDKQAKKRSFVLPLKLIDNELKLLTHAENIKEMKSSSVIVEVETTDGRTVRRKIAKRKLMEAMAAPATNAKKEELDLAPPKESDAWSVHSRVFPWRKVVEVDAGAKKAGGPAASSSAPQVFDFLIKRVWIEPGCIVCDACENEAPDVFQVLEDTCIVREGAPLANTGSIVAAAEGCPVDVIKYDTAPKA